MNSKGRANLRRHPDSAYKNQIIFYIINML